MPLTISFTGKDGMKNVLKAPKEDIPRHQLKKEESKQGDTCSFIMQMDKKIAASKGSTPVVLRYIPKSQRKDGKLLFSEFSITKSPSKLDVKCSKFDWAILREDDVLLVHKAHYSKLIKVPLPSFIASSNACSKKNATS